MVTEFEITNQRVAIKQVEVLKEIGAALRELSAELEDVVAELRQLNIKQ